MILTRREFFNKRKKEKNKQKYLRNRRYWYKYLSNAARKGLSLLALQYTKKIFYNVTESSLSVQTELFFWIYSYILLENMMWTEIKLRKRTRRTSRELILRIKKLRNSIKEKIKEEHREWGHTSRTFWNGSIFDSICNRTIFFHV